MINEIINDMRGKKSVCHNSLAESLFARIRKMDYINSSYCTLTQFLMSILGLWPYQSLWSRVLMFTFACALMVLVIISQVATLFTTKITMAYMMDLLPPLIICVLSLLLFADRYANLGTMKHLLDNINDDWSNIVMAEEDVIMHYYADIAKRLNYVYAFYAFTAMAVYSTSLFTSQVLDIIAPLNETRPKVYPFYVETMIDDDKYFNMVLLVMILALFIVLIGIVANQLLFMLYIHHVCAMFTVIGHRMDKILQQKDLITDCSTLGRYSNVYRNIATCVEDHLKTIQYANKIDSCYGLYYLLILIGGAIVASLFLVIVLSFSSGSTHYLRSAGFLVGQTTHMFLNSYMGQKLTDKSLSISQIIYNSNWQLQTPSVQRLLLLIMLKSSKPCIVSVFGLFVLSFECFSTGVQTVVSYCMVIKQFQ